MDQWLNKVHCGDALEMLKQMPGESIQCVVTSPPYWGLRDYGVEGQLGLEETPEGYVANMVDVFREARRVLRGDGVLWLNIGDSYAANRSYQVPSTKGGPKHSPAQSKSQNNRVPLGLKPKDLFGIPWLLAFALRSDGWYLRQDIIWHKPNPMPESVKDRCTKAHEYLFLMTKSQKYYWNQNAIKEPSSPDSHARYARGRSDNHKWADGGPGNQTKAKTFKHMRKPGVCPKSAPAGSGIKANESFHAACSDLVEQRNRRSVWTIPSQPFSEAHFATFPSALVEPCILAGSRIGDVVLDPFGGSGTVACVASNLGRKWVLLELSQEYCEMARNRIKRESAQLNMFHSERG